MLLFFKKILIWSPFLTSNSKLEQGREGFSLAAAKTGNVDKKTTEIITRITTNYLLIRFSPFILADLFMDIDIAQRQF